MLGDRSGGALPWPADAPRPPRPPAGVLPFSLAAADAMLQPSLAKTLDGRVTHAFLHAAGWMVLHEAGHLVLDHAFRSHEEPLPPHEAMMQEQQADHWAAVWMLGESVKRDLAARVRGILVAFGALCSMFLEPVYRSSPYHRMSHADAPTRMRRFLKTFVPRHREAWRMASLMMELHLGAQKMGSAAKFALGTDEHLCHAFEIIGGQVAWGTRGRRAAKTGGAPRRRSARGPRRSR